MEGFSSDSDDEWLGFNDIFSPAPLVPPGAETFEFAVAGRVLRLTQSVAAFTRRDGEVAGAAEAGADLVRNTSALIWDASVVLATFLSEHHAALLAEGSSCVELGAGAGLVGLSAAACGYPTILTDRAEALPPLHCAVERNGLQVRARVAELPWGCEAAARRVQAQMGPLAAARAGAPADEATGAAAAAAGGRRAAGCLLLADLLYEHHLIAPLLATVRQLSDAATCILLAYDLAIHRHAVYAAFKAACEPDFVWHDLTAPAGRAEATALGRDGPAEQAPLLKSSVVLVRLEKRR